ncbi:hypothetical protein SLA2020_051530 [Shorea laevis]
MAAEKAVDLLLGPVVNLTISKVIEQLDLAVGFKQELMRFHRTLGMVKDVLCDAEQKCVAGSSGVRLWLEGLRSIAEEADDLMDKISYENLRREVAAKKPMLKQVSYFFTASNPIAFRLKMANKIKNLNAELDALNTRAAGLGLQPRLETTPEPRENRQTDSLLGEPSRIIGRDGDVQKIVKLLIDSNTQQPIRVVSIVGIAGLGKTTLAKLVRNNDQILRHFSSIMWICVSDNFDVMRILVQMLESLGEGHRENIINRDAIVQKIKGKLEQKENPEQEEKPEQKNYLLILDDVWNENRREWEDLRDCLLGLSKMNGNRVLVTTRIQNVATVMGVLPEHVHCLKQLKDDDCWSVIRHRVFGNSPIPSELEELETIGRENAKKCEGVPLVASVIGGILCNNCNKDAWCEVWGSIKKADGVLPALQLSFNRLPKPALKQCFAFCSIFPKDFVMVKEMLIQLWMAHGFLQPSSEGDKKMEDIGDDYFNYLLSSSFFQDAKTDSYGSVITCKMHDLFHDLAQSVSEPQTLILGNGSGSNITADIRHLNLISDEGMAAVEIRDAMPKLHTLLSKTYVFHDMPANLKKVRVLSFCDANIDKLPAVLRKLKHLRYFDVSNTNIKELPEFITKLYQLQTLRFMNCHRMKRPLEGIGNLVNLKHLYFNSEKLMPAGVGTLTCLQTLTLFVVGQKKGRQIEELRGLSQLKGKLEITKLKMVRNREEAIIAKLSEKTTIQVLALDFDGRIGDPSALHYRGSSKECRSEERRKHDEDVLEGLQPHSNLKSLRISNYCGEKCPSWMLGDLGNLGESTHLKNLVSLKLYFFPQLKIIPSLPLSNLVELIIDGFDELESMPPLSLSSGAKVQIQRCKNLKSIVAESRLQALIIEHCHELISIGDGLFASTCPNLEALIIGDCENLMSMPSLDGLSSLEELTLSGSTDFRWFTPSVDKLKSLKIKIWGCGQLKSIGESLSNSVCLKNLFIYHCDSLESIPSLDGLSSLETLSIEGCGGLTSLPNGLSSCTALETLKISDCDNLISTSEDLRDLRSLETLSIGGCGGLTSLPNGLSSCTALETLKISNCDNLISTSEDLRDLRSLETLSIGGCGGLTSLPNGLSSCTALETLKISDCDNLISISEDLRDLRSLVGLEITRCGKLRNIRGLGETLRCLTRLRKLHFGGFSAEEEELEEYPIQLEELSLIGWKKLENLPCQIQHLTALRTLRLVRFHGIKALPDWLGNLSSLQSLFISFCSSLRYVKAIQRLSNLKQLFIFECPELRGRCDEESGSEWNNISHIPDISIY